MPICLAWDLPNIIKIFDRLRKAYRKIEKFSEVIGYFAMRQWKFHNKNTQSLYKELCDADKHMFDFDMASIDWSDYFYSYVRGIRVYLLKDPFETVPAALKKHYKLKVTHYFFLTVLSLIVLRVFWVLFKMMFSF